MGVPSIKLWVQGHASLPGMHARWLAVLTRNCEFTNSNIFWSNIQPLQGSLRCHLFQHQGHWHLRYLVCQCTTAQICCLECLCLPNLLHGYVNDEDEFIICDVFTYTDQHWNHSPMVRSWACVTVSVTSPIFSQTCYCWVRINEILANNCYRVIQNCDQNLVSLSTKCNYILLSFSVLEVHKY